MRHTPGRGHRRKSDPHKKKKFRKKAIRKKMEAQKAYEDACRRWESLSEQQRKFFAELHPDKFKP
jgi:hypothetical protein